MGQIDLEVRNLKKYFGSVCAVNDVSLQICNGEFFSILGPSGCGKTTLLRIIAGLLPPDKGSVYLRGRCIDSVPAYRRDINTVFQNYALFPHMTVFDNIAFGLSVKKLQKKEIREKVLSAIDLVELEGLENRKPKQLSGGQQQRVALARALVNQPSVLLLDEPLGALDVKLRQLMQDELKKLQKKLRTTFIYVTHDQEEAISMSDRIAIMKDGRIEQVGTPIEIYSRPKTKFIAGFIGDANFFEGKPAFVNDSTICLRIDNQYAIKAFSRNQLDISTKVIIMVRPEKIRILPSFQTLDLKDNNEINIVNGQIEDVLYLGNMIEYIVRISSKTRVIVFEQNYSDQSIYKKGARIVAFWKAKDSVLLSE
ncbi:MAG: ABC transporter ATP-binding protein [Candidatus Hydrogenedentota bacterium]|nr:MAG: ABC transporter ATP-binding protein [Candidatus Hydrogenedentota bacterium]